MTKDFDFNELERTLEILKIKMHVKEFADFAIQKDFTTEQIESVVETFKMLAEKKEEASIEFLLKCSRLPLKHLFLLHLQN